MRKREEKIVKAIKRGKETQILLRCAVSDRMSAKERNIQRKRERKREENKIERKRKMERGKGERKRNRERDRKGGRR